MIGLSYGEPRAMSGDTGVSVRRTIPKGGGRMSGLNSAEPLR